MSRRMTRWSATYVLLFIWLISSPLACERGLPRERVEAMEANHPWLVFNPTVESQVFPFGDKQDPNTLYLVYTSAGDHSKEGDAVRINLKTKESAPYHFNVPQWEDVEKITLKYSNGFRYESSDGPLWIEFRGEREDRVVNHMYGDPVPNKLGKRTAELRTGYYYIIDERNNKSVELLRVKIANSELDFVLGNAFLSPDSNWIVFVLSDYFKIYRHPSKVFIFKRKAGVISDFKTDHNDLTIEVWNGDKMGAKP